MLLKEQVQKIAHLARLHLSDQELEKYTQDLSGILDLFETLKDVDTDGVTPTAQVTGLQNITQEDLILGGDEDTLSCSPRPTRDGMVSVPSVF